MNERIISGTVICDGAIQDVWQAWTTENGATTFFAPACKIEPQIGGAYEMYFNPDGAPGQKGGEGLTILALQKHKMLSFTWNAPPHIPTVRGQFTSVIIRFDKLNLNQTRCTLFHSGWGDGGEWDEAFEYFSSAWLKVVLPRLVYRFKHGPIDWNNPPPDIDSINR